MKHSTFLFWKQHGATAHTSRRLFRIGRLTVAAHALRFKRLRVWWIDFHHPHEDPVMHTTVLRSRAKTVEGTHEP